MVEAENYNDWDEALQRRKQFIGWLLRAWQYLDSHGKPYSALNAEDILQQADESDYPLWEMAKKKGLIGESLLARELMIACGIPIEGAIANSWEKSINYAPVIKLPERLWREIHGALGWANRNSDPSLAARNFWLWSNAGNIVRFVIREEFDQPMEGAVGDETA